MSKLVGERTKENPADIIIKSHGLMMRGGYLKQVSNGIYSLMPPTKRIAMKVEKIIREEMDKIDGQEVLFPVVMPRELWESSGRYSSIGGEMVRFNDRNEKGMVLGMTHEEAAVHMAKNTMSSYNQMPFMIYQIQTKFRDEKRSRGGLIRVREFTMKDAYSFHINQADLEEYYERCFKAYERIFKRIGMKDFVAVKADSGMMGGSISHEFMLLTDIGEDTLAICPACDYKANMEVAEYVLDGYDFGEDKELEEVFTGDAKEISEVCDYLKIDPRNTLKAVSFAIRGEDTKSCLVFIRGDLEVNEAKVKKAIGMDIAPNDLTSSSLVAGNIGPVGLSDKDLIIVFDKSVESGLNLVCGANKAEYHLTGLNVKRDLKVEKFYDLAKAVDGGICPVCGKPIALKNGIEIGNIFQLGTKYTEKMGMTVLDNNGRAVTPIMGCYGIGVGRAIASVAEESNDDRGIIWPMSIAPWQVYLCPIKFEDEKVKPVAEAVLEKLEKAGLEVILDDRKASAGFKFADHELLGVPLRVVISPRSLETNSAEVCFRDGSEKIMVNIDEVTDFCKTYVDTKLACLNS